MVHVRARCYVATSTREIKTETRPFVGQPRKTNARSCRSRTENLRYLPHVPTIIFTVTRIRSPGPPGKIDPRDVFRKYFRPIETTASFDRLCSRTKICNSVEANDRKIFSSKRTNGKLYTSPVLFRVRAILRTSIFPLQEITIQNTNRNAHATITYNRR